MASYKRVPVGDLYVDERYQRPLDKAHVKRISKGFDDRLVGTLEVSQRNGTGSYAVFDGQHRLEAAKLAKIAALPCLVHKGLTPEEEAGLFVALQRQRKSINPLVRFRARLFMGEETAIAINDMALTCGFKIGDTRGSTGTISAVAALERIYARGNLAATLTLVSEIWAGDDRSTDGPILDGMSVVEQGYGHRLTDKHLEKLRAVAPTVILRRALGPMGGGSSTPLVAAEIRKTAGLTGRPKGAGS